jgi:hypothetical protein
MIQPSMSHMTRRAAMLGACTALVAAHAPLGRERRWTLAQVIDRNTRARGGAAALDRMHSVAMDVEIVEKNAPVIGRYAADRAGFVRIDIYAGGKNVYAEGVDSKGVWLWEGGDSMPQPSKATGAANALTNGAENHLFGWNRFAARGHKLALMEPAMLDGVHYQVVEVRYATGQTSYFYVDPVTWRAVRRRDERSYHPDLDPTKRQVESRFYDFVSVGGVIASHRSADYDLGNGALLSTNRTLARRINPPLPAGYFERSWRAPRQWA